MESTPYATERPLPQVSFYSVEYPGYVSSASSQLALQSLGGQIKITNALKRNAPKSEALVELSLRQGDPFAHPLPGDIIGTNNLLLRMTKKKRKRTGSDGTIGEYTAFVVGIVTKTVRFRSMADYQYVPNVFDPVSQLRVAMNNMEVSAIRSYTILSDNGQPHSVLEMPDKNLDPQLKETLVENQEGLERLRLFPPPLFSRQTIPQGYNFKGNSASILSTTVDEETGEEKKRMINKMRWKGYGPAAIMFSDIQVPDKPPQAVQDAKEQINRDILQKLKQLFVKRPIWTRMSLFNQFSPLETREILNSKLLLPLVCYVFQDGPWRDTLVQFNYDPRQDQNARFYQRLYFRNANHPIARPSVVTRRQDRTPIDQSRIIDQGMDIDSDRRKSHIFDGQTITKETAAFQLCDITDPMLKTMIGDTDGLREACNERDGWFTTHTFERIKTVLRHKFFSVLEGHPASDEECRVLLASHDGIQNVPSTSRSSKLRAGKHNMAKGALRPEDAAAMRLRATLNRNAKSLQTGR